MVRIYSQESDEILITVCNIVPELLAIKNASELSCSRAVIIVNCRYLSATLKLNAEHELIHEHCAVSEGFSEM